MLIKELYHNDAKHTEILQCISFCYENLLITHDDKLVERILKPNLKIIQGNVKKKSIKKDSTQEQDTKIDDFYKDMGLYEKECDAVITKIAG